MSKTSIVFGAVASAMAMLSSRSASAGDLTLKDGFVAIFDGRTLEGWEAMPAETAAAWTVRDGMTRFRLTSTDQ